MAGVGAILLFHHVRPERQEGFQPNRHLEVAPQFLDELICEIRAAGMEIVSLGEAHRRLTEGDFSNRFVALTFDDGYRDNHDFAYPVLKRHEAPFAIFVPSRFTDGTGNLWWIALERAVAASQRLRTTIDGTDYDFDLTDDATRQRAFETLYWALRALPDECEMRAIIGQMANGAGVATETICREFCMDWQEIAELAEDPLVTIGAHTDTHIMLAKACDERARTDIASGVERMETMLGQRPGGTSAIRSATRHPPEGASFAWPRSSASRPR